MKDGRRCEVCGSPLPAGLLDGSCPACLLREGADFGRVTAVGPLDRSDRGADAPSPATGDGAGAAGRGALETIAETIGPVPRILLRAPEPDPETPVHRPASAELPARAGRLQIFGEIARGGMGAVLKGRDADLGRDLAVKILLEAHRDSPELVRRFVEEAQIGGQLQHPGVVPIYELGAFADRRPYFAMKLVQGQTFAALLLGRPSPAEALPKFLGIFEQVCQTMAYAHARGVIHRDLKPSNVMVGSFGEVQVMDWGLAKVLPRGGSADDAAAGRLPEQETVIATARGGEGDSDLSRAGSVLGTPSYMAPEQARGEVDLVDERADVFALGSILCEILTGMPAFAGRTSGEIQRRAARGDTADALARLDARGADAELVGLARDCLAAEPEDRPRDAGAVSGRVTAYLSGVQERLRTAEIERALAEARAAEERKRRRLQLGLAASILALTTLGGLSLAYAMHQRQARAARVDRLLTEATLLRDQAREQADDVARWERARDALARIANDLGSGADPSALGPVAVLHREVRAGLEAAEADRVLLEQLADIRGAWADDPDGSATDAAYADAFLAAGIDLDALGPEAAGARIRARPEPVALALAAALDQWAFLRRRIRPEDRAGWGRLVAAARVADPDPFRVELRTLWGRPDPEARRGTLKDLAARADVANWPAQSLNLLADAIDEAGDPDAAVALLRGAVVRHAEDVWTNYRLAVMLDHAHPPRRDEAIRYYTAARALRPETAHSLAHALENRGETDEAIAVFQDLVRLRPEDSLHLNCLGSALQSLGRSDEARAAFDAAASALREAIRRRPDAALAHFNLGGALLGRGEVDEAIAAYREAIRLRPDFAMAHGNLGNALMDLGERDEAIAAYREAIRLRPDFAMAHYNLGNALRDLGERDEAIAAYREAIRLDPEYAEAHCNLGLHLRSQGRFAEALEDLRIGHTLGSKRPGWPSPSAEWVRQAEQLVALADRLPALLSGDGHPRNNDERLRLAQVCYDTKRFADAARVWAETLEADPSLADDLRAPHRYNAASAAALAGCGQGRDDPPPDDSARAELRRRALDWLRADLALWADRIETDADAARGMLSHWKGDPDFDGVRDPEALAMLPEGERADWEALWAEVDRLLERAGPSP